MIPGIDTGGGGISNSSSATSSADGRWNFGAVNVGGNAGINFGTNPKTSQAWLIAAVAIAAVLLFGPKLWRKNS